MNFFCILPMKSMIIFYIIKELNNYQNWTMLHSIFCSLACLILSLAFFSSPILASQTTYSEANVPY